MGCIITKSRWVTIKECWFRDEADGRAADVQVMRQWPAASWRGQLKTKHTLLVDLRRPVEQILADFKKETRYEVRRADSKDGLAADLVDRPSDAQITAFADFFDEFATQKSLARINRPYLLAARDSGALSLSRAAQGGKVLVWHSYIVAADRVRLLHSASLFRDSLADPGFRSLVGRANRWLHWMDMRAFAAQGYWTYDFGGWYAGQSEHQKLRINSFKEEFGGVRVCEYDGRQGLTLKGKLYLALATGRGRGHGA